MRSPTVRPDPLEPLTFGPRPLPQNIWRAEAQTYREHQEERAARRLLVAVGVGIALWAVIAALVGA